MRFPRRTAFVTPVAPPHDSGQGIVLGRLLSGFDPDSYAVITSMRADEETPGLPSLPKVRVRRDAFRMNPWLALGLRTLRVVGALWRVRAQAVVGLSGRLLDLPAAWLAARLLRLPFHAWCVDDWLLQSRLDPGERLARALHRRILRGARSVVVPNGALAEELRARDGVAPVVAANPWYDGPVAGSAGARHRVVFTGQVYAAQLDAVENVVEALGGLDLCLDVFSGYVAPGALQSPRVRLHPHRPFAEIARVQQEADVLVLALAFRSPYPELIRTSCPTKLSDYLRAGRPVLVHAPADSFPARFCREHDCAVVVDRPDPAAVAAALRALLEDSSLAAALCARARLASELFEPARSRRALLEALSR